MTVTLTDETASYPLVLRMPPRIDLRDDAQLYEFCQVNDLWKIERGSGGEIHIMSPTGGEIGDRNSELTMQTRLWAKSNGTGVAFDSNSGFILPNGAMRSPDAAWVLKSRLAHLTPEQKRRFLPVCPDFVVELRSPSDSLASLREKMQEYIDNGARLGLLLDPESRTVMVYRPGATPQALEDPETVSCDPEMPGFSLNVREIFDTGF